MGEKKFAKDPLLYIHQPTITTPEAPMQHNYSSPNKTPDPAPEPAQQTEQAVKQDTRPVKRNSYFKRELTGGTNKTTRPHPIEYDESDESDGPRYDQREETSEPDTESEPERDKKFKDMTLQEKIYYFTEVPESAPRVKCEIKTDEQTFRGIVTDYQDGDVLMRVGRRTSSTKIPFDGITDIRLLGF